MNSYCFKNISCCECPDMGTCEKQKFDDSIINDIIDGIFRRYGSPSEDTQLDNRIFLVKPDAINDINRILFYDKSSEQHIKELEETIKKLKIYRMALQKRYGYLETSPKKKVIKLKRRKDRWTNKVFYFLSIYDRNMLDGCETMVEHHRYTGKERKKAIEDFTTFKNAHRGIIAEIDLNLL